MRHNDKQANMQFTKLNESYERLKEYCEIRDDITNMADNVNEDGSIHLSQYTVDPSMEYDSDKRDTIKQLCNFLCLIVSNRE
jgi:hypothetical protein